MLWSTIGETALAQSFCSNTGDTKCLIWQTSVRQVLGQSSTCVPPGADKTKVEIERLRKIFKRCSRRYQTRPSHRDLFAALAQESMEHYITRSDYGAVAVSSLSPNRSSASPASHPSGLTVRLTTGWPVNPVVRLCPSAHLSQRLIIIILYIHHALINALSAHTIHINVSSYRKSSPKL